MSTTTNTAQMNADQIQAITSAVLALVEHNDRTHREAAEILAASPTGPAVTGALMADHGCPETVADILWNIGSIAR